MDGQNDNHIFTPMIIPEVEASHFEKMIDERGHSKVLIAFITKGS